MIWPDHAVQSLQALLADYANEIPQYRSAMKMSNRMHTEAYGIMVLAFATSRFYLVSVFFGINIFAFWESVF